MNPSDSKEELDLNERLKNAEGNEELPRPEDNEDLPSYRENVSKSVSREASLVEENSNARLDRVSTSIGLSPERVATLRTENGIDAQLGQNSDEVRELEKTTQEKIRAVPQTEKAQNTPESQESGPERKREYIRESFQEIRGGMLKNILTSETVSNGLNLVPFAGGGKMMVEAIAGQELHGEKLSGKDRIIHGAMGAASLALDFTGFGEMEKGALVVGKSVGAMEKMGATLAEKGATKGAKIFERTARFMTDHPELTKAGEEYAEAKVRGVLSSMKDYKKGNRSAYEQQAALNS